MNIKKLSDLFVSIDGYITANSLTLNFIVFLAGVLIILFILFYIYKVNKTIKNQNVKSRKIKEKANKQIGQKVRNNYAARQTKERFN